MNRHTSINNVLSAFCTKGVVRYLKKLFLVFGKPNIKTSNGVIVLQEKSQRVNCKTICTLQMYTMAEHICNEAYWQLRHIRQVRGLHLKSELEDVDLIVGNVGIM